MSLVEYRERERKGKEQERREEKRGKEEEKH